MAGLVGVVILRNAPVIDEGRLLDFLPPDYTVEQVRVAGIELYVDSSKATRRRRTARAKSTVEVAMSLRPIDVTSSVPAVSSTRHDTVAATAPAHAIEGVPVTRDVLEREAGVNLGASPRDAMQQVG